MRGTDLLTIGETSARSGLAVSALRYYEMQGLVSAERTSGGQRLYPRHALRRLAFIRAARAVGLSLVDIRDSLDTLPSARTPNRADWARLSRDWQGRLDEQIVALNALRDDLTHCIGCGCLSLRACALSNRADALAEAGPGAQLLPPALRPLMP